MKEEMNYEEEEKKLRAQGEELKKRGKALGFCMGEMPISVEEEKAGLISFLCGLKAGHDGNHVARIGRTGMIMGWDNEK